MSTATPCTVSGEVNDTLTLLRPDATVVGRNGGQQAIVQEVPGRLERTAS
jgi:hypothetical protein